MRINGTTGFIAAAAATTLLTACGGTTSTQLPDRGVRTIASGTFEGENGNAVNGAVRVTESYGDIYLVFEDSFSMSDTERVRVGFGQDGEFSRSATFTRLSNFAGEQVFFVPESINPYDFNEVVVYGTKSRSVLGTAELERAPETLTGMHAVETTEDQNFAEETFSEETFTENTAMENEAEFEDENFDENAVEETASVETDTDS